MQQFFLRLFCVLVFVGSIASNVLQAQVGIGVAAPETNAMLEVTSTTRGLLIPRLTSAQRTGAGSLETTLDAVAGAANRARIDGMLVYDITLHQLFYYDEAASSWVAVSAGGAGVGYGVAAGQNTALKTNFLFNVTYPAGFGTATGAVITSNGEGGANGATGLSINATTTGTGNTTGLVVGASGGTNNYAALFNAGNVGIGVATPINVLEIRGLGTGATVPSSLRIAPKGDNTDPAAAALGQLYVNQTGDLRYRNGSGWITLGAGLTLPYTQTVANAGPLFSLTNSSTGAAISASAGSTGVALQANSSTGLPLLVQQNGTGGFVAEFDLFAAGSAQPAVLSTNFGTGAALEGVARGNGPAAFIRVNNTASTSASLVVQSNTTVAGTALATFQGGNVGIGTTAPNTKAILDLVSPTAAGTEQILLLPRIGVLPATLEAPGGRLDPSTTFNGAIYYNNLSLQLRALIGGSWVALGAGGGGGVNYGTATAQNTLGAGQYLFNVEYVTNPGAALLGARVSAVTNAGNTTGLTLNASGPATNTALTASAAGGTNNYAAIFTAGNVGIGTTTPAYNLAVSGVLGFFDNTVAATNGANNDFNLGAFGFARIAAPTAAFAITGIANPAQGKLYRIYNASGQSMTIANENAGSAAGNRIRTLTGADLVIANESVVTVQYAAGAGRWIVVNSQNAGAAGGGANTTLSNLDANGITADLNFSGAANRTLGFAAATAAGRSLTIQSNDNSGGLGGDLILRSASGSGGGGNINILTGGGSANSGSVIIRTGAGGGVGGSFDVRTGNNPTAGYVRLVVGDAVGGSPGGYAVLAAGGGAPSQDGGNAYLRAGNDGGGGGPINGGNVYVYGGTASGGGTVGRVLLAVDSTNAPRGNVGIGTPAPTARLHLPAGAAAAGAAPLKITATGSTLLSTTEPGAIESDGSALYFTNSIGTRQQFTGFGAPNNVNITGGTLANVGINSTGMTLNGRMQSIPVTIPSAASIATPSTSFIAEVTGNTVISNITGGANGNILYLLYPNAINSGAFQLRLDDTGNIIIGNLSGNLNSDISAGASVTLVFLASVNKWVVVAWNP